MIAIEGLATSVEMGAAARSRLYQLLTRGFAYPDPAFFASLTAGEYGREVADACLSLPFEFIPPDELAAQGGHVDFQAEFLRLFEVGVGSPPCPLHGGLFRGGRKAVMEELTRFYNYFGLSIERGAGELPDHITTELEFMHFLGFKELWALHHEADPWPYRRAQADFLERQLLSWLPRLRARLEPLDPPPFYAALVRFTDELVRADLGYLRRALAGAPAPEGP